MELSEEGTLAVAIEYAIGTIIPNGMRHLEHGGNTIFEQDGKRFCVLEKILIYRVDLDCPVEEVSGRLSEAIHDFNAKTGTALLFGADVQG